MALLALPFMLSAALLDESPAIERMPIEIRRTSVIRGPEASPSGLIELVLRRPLAQPANLRVTTEKGKVVFDDMDIPDSDKYKP